MPPMPKRKMRVLVACEFSGVVRRAFRMRGHDAWSCDLLPADDKSPYHLQCDVLTILDQKWDLMIAHPPCTYLCVSGAHLFKHRRHEQNDALRFVRKLLDAPIPKICLENPIGIISTRFRKHTQVIHPWQFGHGETKTTCLWLKGLKTLKPTNIVSGRQQRLYNLAPSKNRWKIRSTTFTGIAEAMAEQWG